MLDSGRGMDRVQSRVERRCIIEVLIISVIALALFAWWASALTNNRGRGRALGILLGLVLGILGVLIAALLPANKRAQWEREEEWSVTRGSTIRRRDRDEMTCEHCGRRNTHPRREADGVPSCSWCGERMEAPA